MEDGKNKEKCFLTKEKSSGLVCLWGNHAVLCAEPTSLALANSIVTQLRVLRSH
jgi:hypothetical protein